MMQEAIVVVPFYEGGRWVDHEVPRSQAKDAITDMVQQMSDEKLGWFCLGLTVHQLVELAECVRTEMLGRERARSHPPDFDRLKIYGER